MKIDRERFFVFTAALAAGCGGGSPTPAGPETIQVPLQPIATAAPTVAPMPMPPEPTAQVTPPVPSASVVVAKAPNPYDGTPVTAQACDVASNKIGTPPKCAIAPPGPTCESIEDTKKECPTMTSLLKPRVAQAAIECMNRKSKTNDICEFNESSICAYEALGSACLDPSAKAVCDGVLAKCGPAKGNYNKMSRESCEAGVSGIADAKRKKFIACISSACRFETCLTYL